jgi:hypothetical protein
LNIKKASVIGLIGSLIMFLYQFSGSVSYMEYYSITSNLVNSIKILAFLVLTLFFLVQGVNQIGYKLNLKIILLICMITFTAEALLDMYLLVNYHTEILYIALHIVDIIFSLSIIIFLYQFLKSITGKNLLNLKMWIYIGLLGCILNFICIIFTEIFNVIATDNFINKTAFANLEQLSDLKNIDLNKIRFFSGWDIISVYYKNDLIECLIGIVFTTCVFIYLYNLYKAAKENNLMMFVEKEKG